MTIPDAAPAPDRSAIEALFAEILESTGRMGGGAARRANPILVLRATQEEIAAVGPRMPLPAPSLNVDVAMTLSCFAAAVRQPEFRKGEKDPRTGLVASAERVEGVVHAGADGLAHVLRTFGSARNLTRRVHLDKAAMREAMAALPTHGAAEAALRRFRRCLSASISREAGASRARSANTGPSR